MTWAVPAEPQRFDEAVAWFADRFPVTEELAAELGDYAGERAWTIAGVTQLEVVQSVHDSLERAIESGIPFEEWQKAIEPELTAAWGRKDTPRLTTIFINATQQSYNAGRWEQMTAPEILSLRPYGFFDGVNGSRQSDICRACDGTILPLDDPWWQTHSPQLHHRCRSGIRSLRTTDAERRGVTKAPPKIDASDGFGETPTVARWAPDPAKHDPKIWNAYEAKAKELEKSPRRLAKTG